jgi:hypothetical protein
LEAEVRSPFIVWRKVDLLVKGLPVGWHAVVDHAWVWVEGHGTHAIQAVIWTDLGTPAGREKEIPPLALPRLEGWTSFDHRYLPIGGILAPVKAVQKVVPDCQVNMDGRILVVTGCLRPPLVGVPITIEVVDEKGGRHYFYTTSNADGCYELTQDGHLVQLPPGSYTVQVFITAGGGAAETACEAVNVQVK